MLGVVPFNPGSRTLLRISNMSKIQVFISNYNQRGYQVLKNWSLKEQEIRNMKTVSKGALTNVPACLLKAQIKRWLQYLLLLWSL